MRLSRSVKGFDFCLLCSERYRKKLSFHLRITDHPIGWNKADLLQASSLSLLSSLLWWSVERLPNRSRLWFPPPGFFYSVATADVAEVMVLNTELLNVPQGNNSQCIYSTMLHGKGEVSAKCGSYVNGVKEARGRVNVRKKWKKLEKLTDKELKRSEMRGAGGKRLKMSNC